jgi:ribonucleoside-diphosphate reductase alpha chain
MMSLLEIPGYFTKESVNPFDLVIWEKRHVKIERDDGSIAFEMRDAEFPISWSVRASNIVASKYFRVVDGVQETSVRQMIQRVVNTIATWGLLDSYFDDKNAIIFNQELCFILLHQLAAFNSPVWFNVGVQTEPQCSACFILDVEDNMESILEWYRTEGMIFKNGSGAGVNISKLRPKNAAITSGGKASGPVSFMRGADTNAGVIKSGGTTRRAAKMVIMDHDHPDIEEFIWCKVRAEEMAHALIDAGYDGSMESAVQEYIPFQNANNSVSVTDDFMQLASWPRPHGEKGLLLHKIASAAWMCGDPGLFFVDTINSWHTTPGQGRIVSTNPCSEFMRPPDEACNLASINLLPFLRPDGSFDAEAFKHTVDVLITAMDIIVDRSSYPTDSIAKNSHDFRSLGLGYANLGALLMAKGLPYSSAAGRLTACDITSLMTGEAYLQSAKIAKKKGPFSGYPENGDEMLAVIEKHKKNGRPYAADIWRKALQMGKEHGFRNCQVTLLAPTGTISFLMDCETTGIEPCLGLIQDKKLVGGGSVKMINKSFMAGLTALGYDQHTRNKIQVELENTGSLQHSVESGLLDPTHMAVFATALGDNTISWRDHIAMVAIVQPLLSGAVSKTINMPNESTVEDIEQAFIIAWQLGLKSVAVYRDGCKTVQPVTVQQSAAPIAQIPPEQFSDIATLKSGKIRWAEPDTNWYLPKVNPIQEASENLAKAMFNIEEITPAQPPRVRLPVDRPAHNHKFKVGNHEGYLNVGMYPDTNRPGELFITMSKEGSTVRGLMDTVGVLTSLLLQYGVPLSVLTDKLRHTRFEPSGFTGNPKLPMASSVIDYIFRWLSIQFDGDVVQPSTDDNEAGPALQSHDAPLCPDCGVLMLRRTGNCFVCDTCGMSAGCS